ncbi:Tannase/feruloyl esterase [Dactylonectria estremocensis]|uniref:Carboxylic ester hydrolase n=1 Tax=Dactylonectria estremocensis TaxID=1079267 RepID=A0A9P9DMR8_9HYPO|nr:Tannase/feruloyl esterase [Dactylonectria estremocensis]
MAYPAVSAASCAASAIPTPTLFGAEILSLSASLVSNYSGTAPEGYNYNHPTIRAEGVDFCNVTITYTHPGQNDTLNVENWLPLSTWNGRIQSVGGGGWVAGRFPLSYMGMTGAIGDGYVASSTDAGLLDDHNQPAYVPDGWALVSEGNVNMYNLQNLASVSLNDQSILVKALTESFYGQQADYAYWSGCSQGGRQGLMLAQRYPHAYDGIAAAAPAIYWTQFFPASIWAQVLMQDRGEFPPPCEFDYITKAAVAACDPLDGITDGLVSDESACDFNPFGLVGETLNCPDIGKDITLSETAAFVANATWNGPWSPDGRSLWYGPNIDARITGNASGGAVTADRGYAQTLCVNGTCEGAPVGLGDEWFKYYLTRNSSWSWEALTPESFAQYFHASVQQYDSIIGTSDADLSEFRAAGGKLITYHGTADGLIPFKDTVDYYNRILGLDPQAQDFYRFFEVPGLSHCAGGSGGQPTATWNALLTWVENGTAPDSLPINFTDPDGNEQSRILCPYPKRPTMSEEGNGKRVPDLEDWECKNAATV